MPPISRNNLRSENEGSAEVQRPRVSSGRVPRAQQTQPARQTRVPQGHSQQPRPQRTRQTPVQPNALSNQSPNQPKKHKQNFIARLVNDWFDRVMGAVKGGGLSSSAAEYGAHQTSRDFIWNSISSAAWAMVFPIVTIVATRLVGVEQAGMISMAFVVGLLLMFLGNFGARTYQVSDLNNEHTFTEYQINRFITCALMLVAAALYCAVRGYSSEMFNITMGVVIYRLIDALADLYEGRLQQVDKFYLGGVSMTIRSVVVLVVFCIALAISRNAVFSCYAMAISSAVTFVLVTYPLTLMESPSSRGFNLQSFMRLFKLTAPLFVGMFLFNVIENMPKFVMEGTLAYENQLYYNALYFPAQIIHIGAQLVYKPLLLRMAEVWQDAAKRKKFDLILLGIMVVIVAITAVVWLLMAWIGVPVMNVLYGLDFEPYRGLLYVMLVAGGVVSMIDFLYQVITIMRCQKDVTTLYCVTFGFSIFIPLLLVSFAGLNGAILSYLIVETILLVLLVWEYLRIRHNVALPAEYEQLADGEPVHKRPSEVRAEREHREEVLRRRRKT